MLVEICSWIFILLGSFLLLTGSLGLIRLPDFWSRLHGASISDTGGVLFLILGMMLHVTTIWVFFKTFSYSYIYFYSSPTASHAIANAAFVTLGYKKKEGGKKIELFIIICFFIVLVTIAIMALTLKHLFAVIMLSGAFSLVSAMSFVVMDAVDVVFY